MNKENKSTLTFEQVGEFINSQEFANMLAQYEIKDEQTLASLTNKLIGIAMDYADIFRNSGTSTLEEMKEILNGVIRKDTKKEEYDIIKFYEKKLLRDVGLHKKEELTPEEDEMVKNRIIDILAFKQTKFHAFNGNFLDSIKENGINPETKALENEKNELNEIHKKYNLFWKESIQADTGNVSYSATASVSYNYATTSPEWFNNMCGSKFSIRDYDGARKEFEKTADNFQFSPEDKKRYLELFDKCWNKFASNKMYLAVVPDVIAHDYEDLLLFKLKFLEENSSFAFKILAEDVRFKFGIVNERTNKPISTENASFIELPNIKDLQKRVEKAKQTQQDNEL